MPSVGMRRSTRVFVPKSVVKDADVARVLRSGKRLSSESNKGGGKPGGPNNSEEWLRLVENSGEGADVSCCGSKSGFGWGKIKIVPERGTDETGSDVKSELQEQKMNRVVLEVGGDESGDKTHGIRYTRKRRRSAGDDFVSSSSQSNEVILEDRMYGIQYSRKRRRKNAAGSSLFGFLSRKRILEGDGSIFQEVTEEEPTPRALLSVVVECSCSSSSSTVRFTRFLLSILKFIRRSRVDLSGLADFMCSEPIVGVFSRHGIHFLPDLSLRFSWIRENLHSGACQIFGARQFIPLFSLEFSVAPLSFMRLHFDVLLRSLYLSDVLAVWLMGLLKKPNGANADVECLPSISSEKGSTDSNIMDSGSSLKWRRVDFPVRGVGVVEKSVLARNGGRIHNFQKKRSSLRSRRARNPSSMGLRSSVLISNAYRLSKVKQIGEDEYSADWFGSGNSRRSLSTPGSNLKHRKLSQKSPSIVGKDLKSTLESKQNIDSLCCTANILVTEAYKCYRIEGARVGLECLASKEWFIVIKVEGITRYMHKAQDLMRPSTQNRFTHAMIWTGENGWKLEFSNRQDWLVFKELYKECTDENAKVASIRSIPVPGVHEVESYGGIECYPFVRPDSYISMHHDEVERAMMRKTPNYDMDSDDEEWLDRLNNDSSDGKCEDFMHVSAEKFEEMVDAFEKAAYHCADDVSDERKAINLFSDLGNSNIIAALYQYLHKKRKQKRAPLIRVFQNPPPKKPAQLVQDPVLRKKRSFKQQSNQSVRGQQKISLPVVALEDEQEAIRRVEEAINSVKRSTELAVLKRKRAQTFMDNADLATYKAAMAVKIAEAVELGGESSEAYISFILG